MRKRLISVFLAAIMLFSLCTCFAFAETEGKPVQREHSVEKREFTLYLKDPSVTAEEPLPLFFADGVGDLPYMEIGDFVSVLCMLCRELNDDGNYELDMEERYPVVTMTRESGFTVSLDFEEDFIMNRKAY